MGFCDKFKVDRVLCDEIFYLSEEEIGVEIGEVDILEGSTIEGTVTVTVLDCQIIEPIIDNIQVNLSVMVQKELNIIPAGEGDPLPLEFMERLSFTATFRKCNLDNLNEISDFLEDLECQIVRVDGMDDITLNINEGTFDEDLIIIVKIKLTQENQLNLGLCPAQNQVEINI